MDRQILDLLQQKTSQKRDPSWQPVIFSLDNEKETAQLHSLLSNKNLEVLDTLTESIEDLFRIDFPYIMPGSPEYKGVHEEYVKRFLNGQELTQAGVWVYYPWRSRLIHLPAGEDYYKLRTARNKFLITPLEQEKFYNARIGIGGLSVGSSAVNSLTLSGGGKKLRLADHDTLAITNLNRLLGSAADLSESKCYLAARRSYELNPFQEIDLFQEGLTEENFERFFGNAENKLDLFVEEMDDIRLKILSRVHARKLKIPVIMATDNGDNAMIDVERFDLEPERPLFHSLIPEQELLDIPAKPTMSEKVRLAGRIVGFDITPRTQSSLMQVGSTLPAWPQLGNAATLSGLIVSYVARRILVGDPMPSGRYDINLDGILDINYHAAETVAEREQLKQGFIQGFQLLYGKDDHE